VAISEIGKLVMEARAKSGLNQESFGKLLGVGGQTISNLQTGATAALQKLDSVRELARLLERPVEEVSEINRRCAKGESDEVFIPVPRTLYEKALPFADAMHIQPDQWVKAAIEAMLRLQGTPEETKAAVDIASHKRQIHAHNRLNKAAKKAE
jgi:DNA-binding XRE family transcriptional regulator